MSSARREPSQRKAARERYLASAHDAGLDARLASAAPATPAEPCLTERVRALYEGAVVPVREIARLVGVHPRTLYRHARKGGWRRRVRWPVPAGRGPCRRRVLGMRALYEDSGVPVREIARLAGVSDVTINTYARKLGWRRRRRRLANGAVARLLPFAQAGKLERSALKACDGAGGKRAAERCARAKILADDVAAAAAQEAQMRAARLAAERDAQARLRAFEQLNAALVELARFLIALCEKPDSERTRRAERLAARLQRAIGAQIERLLAPATACQPVALRSGRRNVSLSPEGRGPG